MAAAPTSAVATSVMNSDGVAAGPIAEIADQHRSGSLGDTVRREHDAITLPSTPMPNSSPAISGMIRYSRQPQPENRGK